MDIDIVLRFVEYCPRTGEVRWKQTHSRKAVKGEIADYRATTGYRVVYLQGRWLYSHRIAWASAWGKWPPGVIDHINGDPGDNRWGNIRLANRSQNQANHKRRCDSSSGIKGVGWNKQQNKWQATVKLYGKVHHGGFFDTIESAGEAVKKLRLKVHGQFTNHG